MVAHLMDLTSILSLIPGLRDENNVKYKNHFQLRKYKRLNMHKWETLDLWIMKSPRKVKMSDHGHEILARNVIEWDRWQAMMKKGVVS